MRIDTALDGQDNKRQRSPQDGTPQNGIGKKKQTQAPSVARSLSNLSMDHFPQVGDSVTLLLKNGSKREYYVTGTDEEGDLKMQDHHDLFQGSTYKPSTFDKKNFETTWWHGRCGRPAPPMFNITEYDLMSVPFLQVDDDNTWRSASIFVHKINFNAVIWYGKKEYEGLLPERNELVNLQLQAEGYDVIHLHDMGDGELFNGSNGILACTTSDGNDETIKCRHRPNRGNGVTEKKSQSQADTKKNLPLLPCRVCKRNSTVQNGFCIKGYGHRKDCTCPSRQCTCECSVDVKSSAMSSMNSSNAVSLSMPKPPASNLNKHVAMTAALAATTSSSSEVELRRQNNDLRLQLMPMQINELNSLFTIQHEIINKLSIELTASKESKLLSDKEHAEDLLIVQLELLKSQKEIQNLSFVVETLGKKLSNTVCFAWPRRAPSTITSSAIPPTSASNVSSEVTPAHLSFTLAQMSGSDEEGESDWL